MVKELVGLFNLNDADNLEIKFMSYLAFLKVRQNANLLTEDDFQRLPTSLCNEHKEDFIKRAKIILERKDVNG